jgi:hypothetical protein
VNFIEKKTKKRKKLLIKKKKSLKQNLPMTIMKKSQNKRKTIFIFCTTKHYVKENLKKLKNLLIKYWRKKLTKKTKRGNYSKLLLEHSYGDTFAFNELENYTLEIENDNDVKSVGLYYLSLVYKEANNYEKAIDLASKALEITTNSEQKSYCISKYQSII